MHPFRRIIALVLALFIAGPACCCLGLAQPVKQAEHSCCGGQKEKKETVCNCTTAGHQKLADADIPLPPALAAAVPAPVMLPAPMALPSPRILPAVVPAWDTGPPRLRLAVLQRFMI